MHEQPTLVPNDVDPGRGEAKLLWAPRVALPDTFSNGRTMMTREESAPVRTDALMHLTWYELEHLITQSSGLAM